MKYYEFFINRTRSGREFVAMNRVTGECFVFCHRQSVKSLILELRKFLLDLQEVKAMERAGIITVTKAGVLWNCVYN